MELYIAVPFAPALWFAACVMSCCANVLVVASANKTVPKVKAMTNVMVLMFFIVVMRNAAIKVVLSLEKLI